MPTNTQQKIVPFPNNKEEKKTEKKFGKETLKVGYSIVPSLLFKAQRRLGLDAVQITILMHLLDFWWDAERKPYPSKATLAERMNLSPRQIQRKIAELEKAGLVQRVERRARHKGKLSNYYDLSGLVAELGKLAPEFIELGENEKKARRAVSKPGGLKRNY